MIYYVFGVHVYHKLVVNCSTVDLAADVCIDNSQALLNSTAVSLYPEKQFTG